MCKRCVVLEQRLAQLEKENAELRKRVAQLEELVKAKLKPEPPPFAKPNLHHESKPPGQKEGHEGTTRPMPEKFDEEKTLSPEKCPDCGGKVSKPVEMREHIVEDIIPARLIAKRYILTRHYCPKCKKLVELKPIDVFPNFRFGLNLCILILILRMIAIPINKIQSILMTLFKLEMSSATVENILYRCADEFDGRYNEIFEEVRKAGNVNADETGSRVNGENWWLWVFVARAAALYKIEHSRGRKVVEDTLGKDFAGVLSSDCHTAYESMECRKQKCLRHYLGEIKKWEKKFSRKGEFAGFAKRAKKVLKGSIRAHKRLKSKSGRLRAKKRFEAQLCSIYSKEYENPEINRICKNFRRHASENFTFLEFDGVEPTNNEAERAIRPYVVMRKISGSHRSERGAAACGRLLSVYRTSQLRGENFKEYATGYLEERLSGTSKP
jgi:transposase